MLLPRRTVLSVLLALAALGATSLQLGCKREKIMDKITRASTLLKEIRTEEDHVLEELEKLETLRDPFSKEIVREQIRSKRARIDREDELLTKWMEKEGDEIKELSTVELEDILRELQKSGVRELFEKKFGKFFAAADHGTDIVAKVDALAQVNEQTLPLVDELVTLSPGPDRDAAVDALDTLIVKGSGILVELGDDIRDLDLAADLLQSLGPLPVVAGSTIEHAVIFIEQGLPEGLDDLDDGVLAAGTKIRIQLPAGWILTRPAEFFSENLVLSVEGNVPGSNVVLAKVLSERIPSVSDTIRVTFNGIKVSEITGLGSGILFVNPGRVQQVDFFVTPIPGNDPPDSLRPIS